METCETNHYAVAEAAGLAGPIAVVSALVDHLDREGLVTLEAALYDASSAEFDRMQTDCDRAFRAFHRARWDALRGAAGFCSSYLGVPVRETEPARPEWLYGAAV